MLNHKFYFDGSDDSDETRYIRISDMLIEKMRPDLCQYRFMWSGDEQLQYGLSQTITIISLEELKQFENCLLKQSPQNNECKKLMALIHRALEEKTGLIHKAPDYMPHEFVICSEFPEQILYNNYKDMFIKLPDQFIMENYNVFKRVKMYWESTEWKRDGFNYYGTTLITSNMAQDLLETMKDYLQNNTSEQAEYFAGREYELLSNILRKAVEEEKVILHFGI